MFSTVPGTVPFSCYILESMATSRRDGWHLTGGKSPLRHLVQPRTRIKSVFSGTLTALNESVTQKSGDKADVYSIAVRCTCWMHDNFPRTLQGSVAEKLR